MTTLFSNIWTLRNPYFIESLVWPHVSLLSIFFRAKENTFLNTRYQDAIALERLGNFCLAGYQYLFDGKTIVHINENEVDFTFIYSYEKHSYLKTTAAIIGLIPGLIIGSFFKGLSFIFSSESRDLYFKAVESYHSSSRIKPVNYSEIENFPNLFSDELAPCQNLDYGWFSYDYLVKKNEQLAHDPVISSLKQGKHFTITPRQRVEINALREIASILNAKKIPWWVEAGTCLGAFRNQNIIPWDHDVDIAIPRTEFANVYQALKGLNSQKYEIQDWSPDIQRNAYLRVYIKETQTHLDIYIFDLNPQEQTITYIGMTQYTNMPDWFKALDKSHVIPFSFDDIFPLRPTKFADIDVWVPNRVQEYLQDKYAAKSGGREGPVSNINPNVYWDPSNKQGWVAIDDHSYPTELNAFISNENY